MRCLLVSSVLIVAFAAKIAPVHAASLTYAFEGVVYDARGSIGAMAASVGDPISGTFTYRTDAGLAFPPTSTSAFYSALTDLTFAFGSYEGSYGSPSAQINDIWIHNEGSPGSDLLQVRKRGVNGAAVGGLAPFSFGLSLKDDSGSVFSSLDLPVVLPPLSDFDIYDPLDSPLQSFSSIQLVFGTVGSGEALNGRLTGLVLVPEPGTALLVLSGLVLMASRGRGVRKGHHR
jgi:hypothetical protein